jgi:hypothetical protein
MPQKTHTIDYSSLPDDMQVLLWDFFQDAGHEGCPQMKFPIYEIPVANFPDVIFTPHNTDDRGGEKHAKQMLGVANLPPVVVADGWFLDGRHRIWAARKEGWQTIRAIDLSGYSLAAGQGVCAIGPMKGGWEKIHAAIAVENINNEPLPYEQGRGARTVMA